jgi:hypothetical protein
VKISKIARAVELYDENGVPYGVKHVGGRPSVTNYIWDTSGLGWVAEQQSLLKTDTLSVSGTMDITATGQSLESVEDWIEAAQDDRGVGLKVAAAIYGYNSGGTPNVNMARPVKVSADGTVAVSGSFYQATQPISGSVALTAGSATVGKVNLVDNYGFSPEFTPMDEIRTVTPYRIVGSTFYGAAIDTNYWTLSNSVAGGTATVSSSQCVLASGATANNIAAVQSVRTGRYIGGSSNRFRCIMSLPDTGTANNIRRWGAFNSTDGAFFQLSGMTFSVVTRKTSSANDILVNSGSFNGSVASYTLDTNVKTYEIYWTNSKVYFIIGGVLIHTVTASTTTWTDTVNLPCRFESGNYNGSETTIAINVRTMTIHRLGAANTLPKSYYHALGQTVATGVNLKIGQGSIHAMMISGVASTAVVTLADSASAATPVIWTTGTMPENTNPYSLSFGPVGCPFFTGLQLMVTAANCICTVVYE